MTNEQDRHKKSIITTAPGKCPGLWASLSPFDVASEDVGHFNGDDHLELTRRARLQTDHAYIPIWVIKVVPGQTPATLRNQCLDCRSLGQPHVRRAGSVTDRCIAGVILNSLLKTSTICICEEYLTRTTACVACAVSKYSLVWSGAFMAVSSWFPSPRF